MNEDQAPVPLGEASRTWAGIGLNSFGGPAGQIAVMHRVLVEEKRWLSEERFLHALNYCMLLPGPEAQQLATYCGWLLHGWRGGLIAGTLFVLPGFIAILVLSVAYAELRSVEFITALFFGLKAATLALVVDALVRIGRRALGSSVARGIAAAAFIAIFFGEAPFPWIICAAGALGAVSCGANGQISTAASAPQPLGGGWRHSLGVLCLWLALWWLPVLGLAVWLGRGHMLVDQAVFFSKSAVVTFGGAYGVLAYIAQQAVDVHGWLRPGEMLDGLGMAETTPGPLIQVVQFVGFMGAHRSSDPFTPLTAGLLASCVTTWVTFAPCFLWIFLGAPYIERLRGNRRVAAALAGVTAAVVGVMFNLALWFGVHVVFEVVHESHALGLRVLRPDVATIDLVSLGIAAGALLTLLRWKWGALRTLSVAMGVGLLWDLCVRPHVV